LSKQGAFWPSERFFRQGGRKNRPKLSSARPIFSSALPIFSSALPIFSSALPISSSALPISSSALPKKSFFWQGERKIWGAKTRRGVKFWL